MSRVKNTEFLLEKNPSSSINGASTAVADYLSVPNSNISWYLPDTEKTNDGQRANVNAARHQCNEYWKQDDMSINDDIDFKVLPRLWRRAMGGTPVRTVIAPGVYEYVWYILPPQIGNILPAMGLAVKHAGAHFLNFGQTMNTVSLSQTGSQRVQHQSVMFGTGKHAVDGIVGSYPVQFVPDCTDGRKTVVKYTDENSAIVNLSALGDLEEWSISLDNLLQRSYRKSGDPGLAVEGVEAGYVRKIPRGNEQENYKTVASINPQFKDLADWKRTVKLKELSNFSALIPGGEIVAGHNFEFEVIIPKFGFESIGTGNSQGDATTPIQIIPFEDPISKGTLKVRLKTDEASFEGVSA